MSDFTVITNGPWRIRTGISDDHAAISYDADGKWDTIASETHADRALLRDAITEYLRVVEATQ